MLLQVVSVVLVLTMGTWQHFESEARDYLVKYGYLSKSDIGGDYYYDHDPGPGTTLEEAIEEFQRFSGLKPTGKLDNDTVEEMRAPRCGVKDKPLSSYVGQDYYVVTRSKWRKKSLTYRILSYPTDGRLSKRVVELEVAKAFLLWERESGLRFVKSASRSADILIKWAKFNHGDSCMPSKQFYYGIVQKVHNFLDPSPPKIRCTLL